MRVPDETLELVEEQGFATLPGFLTADELKAAQDGLWLHFPRPEDYFADPDQHAKYRASQIAGMEHYPYRSAALNLLAIHHDLVDAAERFLGTDDLHLYKIELWAKYAGAVDYDQPHHRDFVNHSLVVPCSTGRFRQLTTFIYLSDVTEADGATRIIPLSRSTDIPLNPAILGKGDLVDREVAITVPAGTLFLYRTDVLHRGSNFTEPGRSRFALLIDFQQRGWQWMGKTAWPDRAVDPMWGPTFSAMSVRERNLFGFPPPQSDYWTEQTLADTAARYPHMDMNPYRAGRLEKHRRPPPRRPAPRRQPATAGA